MCALIGLGVLTPPLFAQTPRPLVSSTPIDSLTFRSGLLFWKRNCVTTSTNNEVQRIPAQGGEVRVLHRPRDCSDFGVWCKRLAVNPARDAFWITTAGTVVGLPHDHPANSPPTVLTSMESPAGVIPPVLTTSSNFVYWTENRPQPADGGKVYRVLQTGGGRTLVLDLPAATGGGATDLQALDDSTFIMLRANAALSLVRRTIITPPSAVWLNIPIASGVSSFCVEGSRIYFAAVANAGSGVQILAAPIADPTQPVLHTTLSGAGSPVVKELFVDRQNIYWQEQRADAGPIVRLSKSGGAAEAISYSLSSNPLYLTGDGSYLFWITSDAIMRLPVDARAMDSDLAATGLEVIQAIQNPANDVPLVMGKTTTVRLFGRILSAPSLIRRVGSWSMAVLHGRDAAGNLLPESPLLPIQTQNTPRLTLDEPDRTDRDEGFRFRLPRSWTLRGTITLQGEINPRRTVHEANWANNTRTVSANFVRKSPICLAIYPLRTAHGTISRFESRFEPLFDLAEHLQPTSELRDFWQGGHPMEEYEPPFGFGPYEVSKDDDDTGDILHDLCLRQIASDPPDECVEDGARIHHMAFFPRFRGQAVGGRATGYFFDALVCSLNLTHPADPDFPWAYAWPAGGTILAHELGHNYGRMHVDCPVGRPEELDPGSPLDPDYPYGCALSAGPTAHLGFSPRLGTLILPDEAADYMSYNGALLWSSDYTWKALFHQLGTMSSAAAADNLPTPALGEPLAALPPRASLVLALHPTNGAVSLRHVFELADAASLNRASNVVNRPEGGNRFYLRARRFDGSLIANWPIRSFPLEHTAASLLVGIVPRMPEVRRVELLSTNSPLEVLASLAGGGAAPSLQILNPVAGALVATQLTITVTTTDPEGAPVRLAVRYSHDLGAHWRVLQHDVPPPQIILPTANLPGGSNSCIIQVLASDGLLTTVAQSAPFTLLPDPPSASVTFETEYGRNYEATNVTVGVGKFLRLHGRGYDVADGKLADPALGWIVSGRFTSRGVGREVSMHSLPPGNYSVRLFATNGASLVATGAASFTVAKKYVNTASVPLWLDGLLEDDPYLFDYNPVPIRYPDSSVAEVRMVRGEDGLWLGVAGMPLSPASSHPSLSVAIDPNHSGDIRPQTNDWRISVASDGQLELARGNGTNFSTTVEPEGVDARIATNGGSWSVEMLISTNLLGTWRSQTVGIEIVHHDWRRPGDDVPWFSFGQSNAVVHWADVVLGSNPDEPYDGDADGLPDAWELANLRTLDLNGSVDSDLDGMTDRTEFFAGTNPRDPGSTLRVESIVRVGSQIQVTWRTQPGHLYQLSSSTDLDVFVPVGPTIQGDGNSRSMTLDAGDQSEFFRIESSLAR